MTAATGPTPEPTIQGDGGGVADSMDARAVTGLLRRVAALDSGVEIARRHDLRIDLAAVDRMASSTRSRLRHGTAHAVVALAGSTGSGKSSLLNAITGAEIAETGLTRPTTAVTQAVVYPGRSDPAAGPMDGEQGVDGLLDWLDVRRRHHLRASPDHPGPPSVPLPTAVDAEPPATAEPPDLRGLVLLDLPDFDSTDATNRAEVERLVALVDQMIWVTDPEKYADHALHDGFLMPLASHSAVIEVVLNKIDILDGPALRVCLADLDRLLDADGLDDVHPLAVSARTGQGVGTLRELLAAEVATRRAVLERVEADLAVAAARLGRLDPTGGERLDGDVRARLIDGLAGAVGVDAVAALVAAQYRRDATLRTGWPPLRWATRFRRAPIASLPRASRSDVARAQVSQALRGVAEATAADIEPVWQPATRQATSKRTDEIVDALDQGTSTGVQAVAARPMWWVAVAGLHTLLLATAAVGALWLAGLLLADSFLLIDVDALTPRLRGFPLPTLLLLGGLAAGVLLALLARPFVAMGARRRARTARTRICGDVEQIADREVIEPLNAVLADRGRLVALQAEVAGDT